MTGRSTTIRWASAAACRLPARVVATAIGAVVTLLMGGLGLGGAPSVAGAVPAHSPSASPLNLVNVESFLGGANVPTVSRSSSGIQASYNAGQNSLTVQWSGGSVAISQ